MRNIAFGVFKMLLSILLMGCGNSQSTNNEQQIETAEGNESAKMEAISSPFSSTSAATSPGVESSVQKALVLMSKYGGKCFKTGVGASKRIAVAAYIEYVHQVDGETLTDDSSQKIALSLIKNGQVFAKSTKVDQNTERWCMAPNQHTRASNQQKLLDAMAPEQKQSVAVARHLTAIKRNAATHA